MPWHYLMVIWMYYYTSPRKETERERKRERELVNTGESWLKPIGVPHMNLSMTTMSAACIFPAKTRIIYCLLVNVDWMFKERRDTTAYILAWQVGLLGIIMWLAPRVVSLAVVNDKWYPIRTEASRDPKGVRLGSHSIPALLGRRLQ